MTNRMGVRWFRILPSTAGCALNLLLLGTYVAINRNRVVADFRPQGLAVCPDEQGVGLLEGHMAIDAVGRDFVSQLLILAALARLVALHAGRREGGRIALGGVDVMAG